MTISIFKFLLVVAPVLAINVHPSILHADLKTDIFQSSGDTRSRSIPFSRFKRVPVFTTDNREVCFNFNGVRGCSNTTCSRAHVSLKCLQPHAQKDLCHELIFFIWSLRSLIRRVFITSCTSFVNSFSLLLFRQDWTENFDSHSRWSSASWTSKSSRPTVCPFSTARPLIRLSYRNSHVASEHTPQSECPFGTSQSSTCLSSVTWGDWEWLLDRSFSILSVSYLSSFSSGLSFRQIQWQTSFNLRLIVAIWWVYYPIYQWFDWQRWMFHVVCNDRSSDSCDHVVRSEFFSVQMWHHFCL